MGFERISIAMSYLQLITNIRINPLRYTKEKIETNKFAKRLNYEQSIILLAMELAESINYANSNECLAVYKGYTEKNKRIINKYNEEFLNGCFDLLKRRGIFYKKYSNPIKLWFIDSYKRYEFKEIYNGVMGNNTKPKSDEKNKENSVADMSLAFCNCKNIETSSPTKNKKSNENDNEKIFTFNRSTKSFCSCTKRDLDIINSKCLEDEKNKEIIKKRIEELRKKYNEENKLDDKLNNLRMELDLYDPTFYIFYLNYLISRNGEVELSNELINNNNTNEDNSLINSDNIINSSFISSSNNDCDDNKQSDILPSAEYLFNSYNDSSCNNDYSSSSDSSYSSNDYSSYSSDYSSSSSDYSSSSSSDY